jgi:hypothetical protein
MAQRPSFGALKKTKPTSDNVVKSENGQVVVEEPKAPPRIQTSVRLEPGMWAALNDLATRKRIEDGRRVTVHDLLIEGGRHILAVNGIKLS